MSTKKSLLLSVALLAVIASFVNSLASDGLLSLILMIIGIESLITSVIVFKANDSDVWDSFYTLLLWPVKFLFADLLGNTADFFNRKGTKNTTFPITITWVLFICGLFASHFGMEIAESVFPTGIFISGIYAIGWLFGYLYPDFVPVFVYLNPRTLLQSLFVGMAIGLF